jgi:hypothetical protein
METNISQNADLTPAERIGAYAAGLGDWRGERLVQVRQLILDSDPAITEEWKWDTPVWSHAGNVLAFGVFKDHVKLNFFKGAMLTDPDGLFNAGLDAKKTRAIDIYENDPLDMPALQTLFLAAVALNTGK